MKVNHDLAPRGSPVVDLSKKATPASIMKPKYTCFACSEVLVSGDREAHTNETGHMFCKWNCFSVTNTLTF